MGSMGAGKWGVRGHSFLWYRAWILQRETFTSVVSAGNRTNGTRWACSMHLRSFEDGSVP